MKLLDTTPSAQEKSLSLVVWNYRPDFVIASETIAIIIIVI